jgi:hypothetical protein
MRGKGIGTDLFINSMAIKMLTKIGAGIILETA